MLGVRSVGSEGGEGFFERGGVFHVEAFLIAVDLTREPGEDLAGACLDEVSGTPGDEELDALDPADGAGDLAYEAVGDF
jgi:hypothetical protein